MFRFSLVFYLFVVFVWGGSRESQKEQERGKEYPAEEKADEFTGDHCPELSSSHAVKVSAACHGWPSVES